MDIQPTMNTDPDERKGTKTRSMAGKALAVFFIIMVALTWANTMLQEMTIATVSTTTTQRGALEKQITASGTLSAALSVPIIETESARVASIYAQAGIHVTVGAPLYRLDYTDVVKAKQDALQTAQEDLGKKQRSLDWAAADLSSSVVARLDERLQTVAALKEAYLAAQEAYLDAFAMYADDPENAELTSAKQALSQAQYQYETEKRRLDSDSSVRDYLNKKDEFANAETALAEAERELLEVIAAIEDPQEDGLYYRTVFAPVDGYVISSTLSVGAMVSTNSPVMMLSDQSQGLELYVTVDEDSASEMAIGDSASITVGNEVYQCNILSIALSTDRDSMFDIGFLLPGDAGSVGISATMRLRKRTQNYDVIIPLSALREDSDGNFVYVVEQQQSSLGVRMSVRRVDVYVLEQDSTRAALQGGVSQRDTIVLRGDRDISDGDRVRLEE